jgi:diguanylate cyclase (GGDEF)-like protein/PAS domain S-box-containing protein
MRDMQDSVNQKLVHWINRLTEPQDGLIASEKRRLRLLSWLQLVLILLASLALVLTFLVNCSGSPRRSEYLFLITGLLAILALAYWFNRLGWKRASTWLTVLAVFAGPWGSILVDPRILDGDLIPMVYVSLSLLLCSLLISAGITATLSVLQLLGLWLLSRTASLADYNWPSLLAFVFFISVLSILVKLLHQQDMKIIDQQTHKLSESKNQLQAILDNSTSVIYLKDLRGCYLLVNRRYEKLFNLTRKDILGKRSEDIHPKELAELYNFNDQKVLKDRIPLEVEEVIPGPDGPLTYISAKFPMLNTIGEIYGVCSIATEITLQKSNEEALRHQSVRDPLTDLFNRRYMEESLEREIRHAKRDQNPIGIILLDIDQFKHINDTLGHAAGDAVLCALGSFLKANIRGGDIACRYGGDEFVLIFPDAGLNETLERAEYLRETVINLKVQYDGKLLDPIMFSAGVTVFPTHGETSEVLLQIADQALYHAKASGRNKVEVGDCS